MEKAVSRENWRQGSPRLKRCYVMFVVELILVQAKSWNGGLSPYLFANGSLERVLSPGRRGFVLLTSMRGPLNFSLCPALVQDFVI